jgi:predicted Rossmann fold flavoprotein
MDVFLTLEKYIKKAGVVVKTNAKVSEIISEKGQQGKILAVMAGGIKYTAESFIFSTGGVSHPETGSTGDGFDFLRRLDHEIKKPTPTIVPLAVEDAWVKSLAGISIPDMKITFFADGVKKFVKKGSLLCTHFGISGPLILNSAKEVADLLEWSTVTAEIDLFPTLDHGELEKKIIKIFDENKNKILKNVFREIIPAGTGDAIFLLLPNIIPDTKVHSVTKEERKQIVHLLKMLLLTINGLMGFDRAVIADGGISMKELDMKTMRSTLYNNLYVTGDLLHVNRPSGGYSLQLCWTTGYVAGNNA